MQRAKFLVLDGVDGAGKDVQAEQLLKVATYRGIKAALIRFPFYDSFTGRDIVAYQSGKLGELDANSPRLIAYLYAANRVEMRPLLMNWLEENDLLIAVRYVPSNVAYASARLPTKKRAAFRQWVQHLDYKALGNPHEDAVIFLDLPPDLSEQLMAKRSLGRRDIHDENRAYREIVREQYHALAKNEPHWTIVNCASTPTEIRSIEDIGQEIERIVFSNILKNVRMSSVAERERRP